MNKRRSASAVGAAIEIPSLGGSHHGNPVRSHATSPERRTTWWMSIEPQAVRFGAVAVFSATLLLGNAGPAWGAVQPDTVPSQVGMDAGTGSGALRAPMRQSADTPDPAAETDAVDEANRRAAVVAILNQHAIRGAENLARVSAVPVPNASSHAEFVVDARAERVLAASAAATAAAVAKSETALSVQATVEALAASDATTAAALVAAQQADAATATRIAQAAAVTATQEAQAAATREAEAATAAATARADALAAATEASKRQLSHRVAMLMIALIALAGGILGFRLWRNKKEPFVLKAIPVNLTANAHV